MIPLAIEEVAICWERLIHSTPWEGSCILLLRSIGLATEVTDLAPYNLVICTALLEKESVDSVTKELNGTL